MGDSVLKMNIRVVAVLFLLLVFLHRGYGQSITGTLIGTVSDAQGAIVPSATVTATNVDTGVSHTTTTNKLGEFRIEFLSVGSYVVKVKAARSFKTFVQSNVSLLADQTQRINATLQLGAVNETVTVTTAPPEVNTSTAELGRTINDQEILGLPLVNRNAYAELSLTAGVQSNSASGKTNPSGTPNFQIGLPSTQVTVNGGIDGGVPMVSYYLDGGINMTGLRNYGNPLPNPDALQEVRVETSGFAAQYGRMSSAVVTAVTKSGTNKFHGSLFEFNRNTDLNATPWDSTVNPSYHRNQFGGTVGGPIRRDKAFFFFSYAGLRQLIGQRLASAVVPTAAERLGDFTAVATKVHLPRTKTQVVGTNASPNCSTPTPNCIPTSLLDKAASNLLSQYIPLPNNPDNTYSGYFNSPTDQDEYLGKFDADLGRKDHVAASYFFLNTKEDDFGGGKIPYSTDRSFAKQQVLNMSDTHTINPTIFNQSWITITRVVGGRVDLPAGVDLGSLGSTFTTQGPKTLPDIAVNGYFTAGVALAGPTSDSSFFSFRDLVSSTKGRHSITYGGEVSLEKDLTLGDLDNFGIFKFATSAPTSTGYPLADLVTGQVASMEQDTPYSSDMANWYYSLFVQDTFRVLPRLTLDLGLRYDLQAAPVEASNHTATFVPGVQSTKVPSAPLGMLFPSDPGVPRGIVTNRWHHVSPRFGIAWDPLGNQKTSIRAGAGVFYGSVTANEWSQPSSGQPFSIRQTFSSIASLSNVYGDSASFPDGDPFPYTFNPSSPRFLPSAGIAAIAQNYQWPLVYQMNVSVQRQLPFHITTTAAYVGTLSHHIPFFIDKNYAPYAPGASTSQTSIDARRPYDPGVLGTITYLESNETASYHSLQISVKRPLTHNLLLSGFYVLSHTLESVDPDGEGLGSAQDFDNLKEERGPSNFDRRHVASASAIWNIDYYRGSNHLLRQAANGWTISTIISLQSGAPFTISTGSNNNFDSANANRPNLVPGVSAFLDPHRSRAAVAAEWFNPAAFIPNGPGVPGGIGPYGADGNTPRNYLRAPGYRDYDLGLFRNISFDKGITFQLRVDAINAFNMVSLSPPTANLASPLDGQITSADTPRLIQVGGRLTF
jgi:hypothetical protein